MKTGLKVLLFAEACFTIAAGMLGPIYAVFVEEIGGNILDASSAWAVFMLTMGIIVFLIGRWEDKLRHKERMVIIGYVIRAIGYLGYVFVYNQPALLAVQIILGIGGALNIPAYDSMYTKFLDKGKEASEWADWEAMYYIMTAFAAIFGGIVASVFGFRALFLIMFIFSLIGMASSIKLMYLYRKVLGIFKISA
ncbi:MAG: MFS transporter [Candidatus Aenigmarchaeota archaeon]|nr:MFS transporter [Candidatus Aenigmarchaeota archaeon]